MNRPTMRRARRSLALRWLAVAAAAGLAAVQAARVGAAAEEERAAWGDAVPVAVAVHDLASGRALRAGDVRVEQWPAALVPGGAVAEAPVGLRLSAAVVAGEALVSARLAPEGLSAVAALVPPGWRALAVPSAGGLGAPVPPLAVGDRVDLLAPDPVASGVVVAVGEDAVTVAVPADDAPGVAAALGVSVVVLALRGG